MNITFNVYSFHARFFRLAYNRSRLPENLCPYFWLLVLAVIMLPLTFPSYLIGCFDHKNSSARDSHSETMAYRTFVSVCLCSFAGLIFCVGMIVLHLTAGWFVNDHKPPTWYFYAAVPAGVLGLYVGWLIKCLCSGIWELILDLKDSFLSQDVCPGSRNVPRKPKPQSVILSFIRAKKQKLCPHIDWEHHDNGQK